MKKNVILLCGLMILASVSMAQKKRPVYISFNLTEDHSGKVEVSKLGDKTGSTMPVIYLFQTATDQLLFNVIDTANYCIIDSVQVKKLDVKSPEWMVDKENFDRDMKPKDKRYNHICMIEKIDDNTFKIIEVVSYIGDIFFAPERRKN